METQYSKLLLQLQLLSQVQGRVCTSTTSDINAIFHVAVAIIALASANYSWG
jgi:hypothetical protein